MKSAFYKIIAVAVGLLSLCCGNTAEAAASGQIVYSSYNAEEGPAIFVHNARTETVYQISDPIDPARDIDYFTLDVKGKALAYLSDRETTDVTELYTIDMKKGTNTKVNNPLDAGADVDDMVFDAKGKSLFYSVQYEIEGVKEINRVDLKKGTVSQVSPTTIAAFAEIADFQPLPKGDGVVYIADLESNGQFDLFLSRIATESALKLNVDGENTSASVRWFQVDPKGKGIIYLSDADVAGEFELYYVDLKTGLVTRLNSDLPAGGTVGAASFDPKGKTVVYVSDQEFQGKYELFKVDIKSKVITKLNQPLAADRDVAEQFSIDVRGAYVSYQANVVSPAVFDVYRVSLKKGTIETVTEPEGIASNYGSVQDGKDNVYYIGNQNGPASLDLYVRNMKSGTTTRVDDPDQLLTHVYGVQVDNKGTGALYFVLDLNTFQFDYIYFEMKTGTRHSIQREDESVLQYKLIGSSELYLAPN